MTRSIYGKNHKDDTRSIYGKTKLVFGFPHNEDCDGDFAEHMYIMEKLEKYLQDYANRDFEELAEKLDFNEYKRLAVDINTVIHTTVFNNKLQSFFNRTLEGLFQCVYQYNEFVDINKKLLELKECESIFKNPYMLMQYVDKLQKTNAFNLFDMPVVRVPRICLKPEYNEYARMYGLPTDGIFDADKLFEIKTRFNITN